jgi:hypothetical protein
MRDVRKRDFKSIRDVRKYAPNQTVNWSFNSPKST